LNILLVLVAAKQVLKQMLITFILQNGMVLIFIAMIMMVLMLEVLLYLALVRLETLPMTVHISMVVKALQRFI
jgi:hypothetical protein